MSFFGTSQNVQLSGSFLQAQCQDDNGVLQNAALDLNNVLGNNDGNLSFPGNGWHDSSPGAQLNGSVLEAQLFNLAGTQVGSNLDLNGIISNNNGVLQPIST